MSKVIRINGDIVAPVEGATMIEAEPGVYSILLEGKSYEARVTGDRISISGHTFTWEIDDPRQWKSSGAGADAHGRATLTAPMPGRIVRVLVCVGDDVEAGQGIVVVEAMKMQNEMKAPRAGRVASISVKVDDSVTGGAVLAVIE